MNCEAVSMQQVQQQNHNNDIIMNVSQQKPPLRKKYCALCRNHENIFVLEKGHVKNCKWRKPNHDRKSCKYCIKAFKKVKNAQNWREKIQKKMEGSKEERFKINIVPNSYPFHVLRNSDFENIKKLIAEALATSIHDLMENFYYLRFEDGRLIANCLNEEIFEKIKDEVSTWRFLDDSVKAMSDSEVPKYIYMTCDLDAPITNDEFLTNISSENSLNTSKWIFENINENFRVSFAVDPLSYQFINSLDSCLIIRESVVNINITECEDFED